MPSCRGYGNPGGNQPYVNYIKTPSLNGGLRA